jgi:hypothetical protein
MSVSFPLTHSIFANDEPLPTHLIFANLPPRRASVTQIENFTLILHETWAIQSKNHPILQFNTDITDFSPKNHPSKRNRVKISKTFIDP